MSFRNPASPWNPNSSVEVTPEEYEREVLRWLKKAAGPLKEFKASHRTKLPGHGGEYEFDIVVEFTALGGARFLVLVECKRHDRPLERELVLTLESKLRDVGGHKAIMFSTSGFQRGALEYAKAHGIAAVIFMDGRLAFETRAQGPAPKPPPWAHLPRFVGIFIDISESTIHCQRVEDRYLDALGEWLDVQH